MIFPLFSLSKRSHFRRVLNMWIRYKLGTPRFETSQKKMLCLQQRFRATSFVQFSQHFCQLYQASCRPNRLSHCNWHHWCLLHHRHLCVHLGVTALTTNAAGHASCHDAQDTCSPTENTKVNEDEAQCITCCDCHLSFPGVSLGLLALGKMDADV